MNQSADVFAKARADALRTSAWANRLAAEARRKRHNARVVRHLSTPPPRVICPEPA